MSNQKTQKLTQKQIEQTIEKIEKRLRKSERKPYQVIYDRELSRYIIKTTNKVIYPKFLDSVFEGLNLSISEVIVSDSGFLNIGLCEI